MLAGRAPLLLQSSHPFWLCSSRECAYSSTFLNGRNCWSWPVPIQCPDSCQLSCLWAYFSRFGYRGDSWAVPHSYRPTRLADGKASLDRLRSVQFRNYQLCNLDAPRCQQSHKGIYHKVQFTYEYSIPSFPDARELITKPRPLAVIRNRRSTRHPQPPAIPHLSGDPVPRGGGGGGGPQTSTVPYHKTPRHTTPCGSAQ